MEMGLISRGSVYDDSVNSTVRFNLMNSKHVASLCVLEGLELPLNLYNGDR